ncbi:MAG TPA: SirA family protein [Syntrophomonadaceae bacterium]|nr:SirA family protein [Syntrophomonadaceae bacterium]
MEKVVDARGLSCPLPVLRVKAVLEEGPEEVHVRVDSAAAKENLSRLGQSMGYCVDIEGLTGGEWLIRLRRKDKDYVST